MDDIDEEFKVMVKSHLDNFAKKLVRILKSGMENGEFKKTIDPKKEVLLFIASIEGLFMIHGLYDNDKLVTEMCERLFSSFEDVLFA